MAIPYSRTIIGSLPWYSVLIVAGIALAVWLAEREERRQGLPKDTALDLALVVVPCGIVGARLYYAAMSWEQFASNPVSVLFVWQGGIAIYGAVIGGAIGAWLYARRKKFSFFTLADIIAPGLLLAQAIGRWGNYFNMEAYGPVITNEELQFFPLAVLIPSDAGYVWHAATFFYESVWNACGFAALWLLRKRAKRPGEVFAWYLLLYGSGRFIIEQLRQDSLWLGPFRVSRLLSLILCAAAAIALTRKRAPLVILCISLWLMRWFCLEQPALYAGIILAAGVGTVWLLRDDRPALVWLTATLMLDGCGLLIGFTAGTLSHAIHMILCSATLPMYIGAIWTQKERFSCP